MSVYILKKEAINLTEDFTFETFKFLIKMPSHIMN